MDKTANFQCTRIGGDFHVGDGRVILGPWTEGDGQDRIDHEGGIMEIPLDVAELGVTKRMGKIVK